LPDNSEKKFCIDGYFFCFLYFCKKFLMMQTILPFFPQDTKLINSWVGFREMDGVVYYLYCGNPIYCHNKHDHAGYRFALANLVVNNRCSIKELSDALGVARKNIERYAKALRERTGNGLYGAGYFFGRVDGRGVCYKMTSDKMAGVQTDLDNGVSIYRTALNHGISESAINYHIKNGNLKKTKNLLSKIQV
jgi:hypothetical protein